MKILATEYDNPAFFQGADLTTIAAIEVDGVKVMWSDLTKKQAKDLYYTNIAVMLETGVSDRVSVAASILGTLEDTYPEWCSEFEDVMISDLD